MSKSVVWNYFSKISENQKTFTKCSLCKKTLPFCANTSNMHSHLKTYHIKEFNLSRKSSKNASLVPESESEESSNEAEDTPEATIVVSDKENDHENNGQEITRYIFLIA